jgi:hypothetical protein
VLTKDIGTFRVRAGDPMSDSSHVLTVKFKANGDIKVELKPGPTGRVVEATPTIIEASDKKRARFLAWCEGAGMAVGTFLKSLL